MCSLLGNLKKLWSFCGSSFVSIMGRQIIDQHGEDQQSTIHSVHEEVIDWLLSILGGADWWLICRGSTVVDCQSYPYWSQSPLDQQ